MSQKELHDNLDLIHVLFIDIMSNKWSNLLVLLYFKCLCNLSSTVYGCIHRYDIVVIDKLL